MSQYCQEKTKMQYQWKSDESTLILDFNKLKLKKTYPPIFFFFFFTYTWEAARCT